MLNEKKRRSVYPGAENSPYLRGREEGGTSSGRSSDGGILHEENARRTPAVEFFAKNGGMINDTH